MKEPSEKSAEPKKKRQHFVPRFYLRNFSFEADERINMVHIERLRSISQVGVKGQCADDYFYGKDLTVENALDKIEGATATIIRACIDQRQLPIPGSGDDFAFRTFVCLQQGRTRSHAENSEALFDKALKAVHSPQLLASGVTQEQIDEVRVGTEYPGLFSLGMSAEFVPFMSDLQAKLVVAGSHGEFVTSDAPVVAINPYLIGRYPGSVTGLNSRGLVILFPITPQLLAIFYDGQCYRVGAPGKRVVSLETRADLVALNNLQFLHADEAVYHHDEKLAAGHIVEFGKVARMRSRDCNVVNEAFSTKPGDNSSLLHMYQEDISYRPAFSFITLLRKRRGEFEPLSQIQERNHAISVLFDQYQRELRARLCKRGFLNYYAAHVFSKAGIPLPPFLCDPYSL